jgi:hypothetical protein
MQCTIELQRALAAGLIWRGGACGLPRCSCSWQVDACMRMHVRTRARALARARRDARE